MHFFVREQLKLSPNAVSVYVYGNLRDNVEFIVTDNMKGTPLYHTGEAETIIQDCAFVQKAFRSVNVDYYDSDIVGDWSRINDDEDGDDDDDDDDDEYEDMTESRGGDYRYVGNCTNQSCAPHLEDMMDQAKEVSYRTLISAVGLDRVKETFPNFDWSSRPRGVTMRNDYAVSYYRSIYNGSPCYYIRESGIEYIFVDQHFTSIDNPKATQKSNGIAIAQDGSFVDVGTSAVFWVRLRKGVAVISQSTAATHASAQTLATWLRDQNVTTVEDDGEEQSVEDFIAWLSTY
jgi:hypothetical protein